MTQSEIDNLKTQLLSAMEHRVQAEREWRDALKYGVKLCGAKNCTLLRQANQSVREAEQFLAELQNQTRIFTELQVRAIINA